MVAEGDHAQNTHTLTSLLRLADRTITDGRRAEPHIGKTLIFSEVNPKRKTTRLEHFITK